MGYGEEKMNTAWCLRVYYDNSAAFIVHFGSTFHAASFHHACKLGTAASLCLDVFL